MTTRLKASLHLYAADISHDAEYTWATLQSQLSCCGVDGPTDWQQIGLEIPHSCNIGNFGTDLGFEDSFETDLGFEYRRMPGCYAALKTALIENMTAVGLAGAGALGLQLGITVLAWHLARGMGQE